MLYIASALSPTAILDSRRITGLVTPESETLLVAKPDKVEAWSVDERGLTLLAELTVWGSVVGIEEVEIEDAKPHILLLLGPPNAYLLLLTLQTDPQPKLIVTSSISLTPPTPSLRPAEFFSGIIAQDNVALVSLWVGVLSCIEIEVEKEKKGRRKSSVMEVEGGAVNPLVFKEHFNINIREHNLLHVAFLPPKPDQAEPVVTFLWLSSAATLQLQARQVSITSHAFNDLSRPIDVVTPLQKTKLTDDTDFNAVPFSCPAARRVLPISNEHVLVIGDEHSVLYSLQRVAKSPRISRRGSSPITGLTTSPRANAISRSPQDEVMGGTGKKRKSSTAVKPAKTEGTENWELEPIWRARQGFGTILAACLLDVRPGGATCLLGDECGRLTVLSWTHQPDGEPHLGHHHSIAHVQKIDMGVASAPSSLTYLDASQLFLSSACGDSSLLSLKAAESARTSTAATSSSPSKAIPTKKGKGRASDASNAGRWETFVEDGLPGSLEVKERWTNLAPLRDFDTVRDEGGGGSHMVVASGASTSNSLRIVRSGVGLEEVLSVAGVGSLPNMWTLSPASGSSTLLCSNQTSTFAVQLEPEVKLLTPHPSISSSPTIAAGLLSDSSTCLQITALGVSAWSDLFEGTCIGVMKTDTEVTSGFISGDLAVIGQRRGHVQVLRTSSEGVQSIADRRMEAEVASVSILIDQASQLGIVVIATWQGDIQLFEVQSLASAAPFTISLSQGIVASSLYLQKSRSSSSGLQLLAGLSDGSLTTYDVSLPSDATPVSVRPVKTLNLGSRPLFLRPINDFKHGDETIIAVGLTERMSLIFETGERIDASAAGLKDVEATSTVTLPSVGQCLAVATPAGISLCKVNSLKKLTVQTLDMGNRSTQRVASSGSFRVLCTGSTVRHLDRDSGEISQTGYFELRDQTSLDLLAEMQLQDHEEITFIEEVLLANQPYIAVGTAVFPDDEDSDDLGPVVHAKAGRLLLITPVHDSRPDEWSIQLVHERSTTGPVYDVKAIHDFLAVAAGSIVSINSFSTETTQLEELSTFSSAFIARFLRVFEVDAGDSVGLEPRLVIGDSMRSVMVLSINSQNGDIVSEVRDLVTHQITALEEITDHGKAAIIADGSSNLLTLKLGDPIESAASFGLHEEISRFRQGSLVPPASAKDVMTPELLFATLDGRIGIVGELTEPARQTLDDLQRNMAKYYKGPGGIEWKIWRRGGNQVVKRDALGFIDGDLVQQYLNGDLMSASETDKVFNGTNTHERVNKLLPEGKTKEPADKADVVRILEAAAGLH